MQLAGLPPVYGIYTGFPGLIYSLFGTSRHAAIGPMSIPALLIAAGVNSLDPAPADPGEYTAQVMAVTLLCGLLLLLMGWLNLGFIVRFISKPVLAGFTSAASFLTIASVVKVREEEGEGGRGVVSLLVLHCPDLPLSTISYLSHLCSSSLFPSLLPSPLPTSPCRTSSE